MEQNSNENMPPPPMLCRSGCGFYGSPSFEGMCSKCFKDTLKRRQQNTSPTAILNQSALSAVVSESAVSVKASSNATPHVEAIVSSILDSPTPGATAATNGSNTTPSVETASPTITSVTTATAEEKEEAEKSDAAEANITTVKEAVNEESSPTSEVKKPKKNKCHTCKKKVGLTGFECRCGGLYCSMHRYSDKHDCVFDYKELAQKQIRKQNPLVVGQKVQKI